MSTYKRKLESLELERFQLFYFWCKKREDFENPLL